MGGFGSRIMGLCLPPLGASAVDGSITPLVRVRRILVGELRAVNEGSPTFNHLLQIHPAAFMAGLLVWAAVFVGLILLLPDTPALIVSIAVTFGHTVGAATWLLFRFDYGYQICNGLFLLSAVVLGLGIRHGWRASPARAYQPPGWHPIVRWSVVAALPVSGALVVIRPRSVCCRTGAARDSSKGPE